MKIERVIEPPTVKPLPGAVLTVSPEELVVLAAIIGSAAFSDVSDKLRKNCTYRELAQRTGLRNVPSDEVVRGIILTMYNCITCLLGES